MLDAKYKRLDSNENIDRNDKHQIVSYAYTFNAKNAGFIYPLEETNYIDKNRITKIGF
ncbi:5-methylcytosine restriction system component- like protein [Brachyspira hampsonii]|uniref:5-methylcytosine restriction system component- like protein n=1 Tax=Brachyspira hampsonii TaxID=1287055 RepID=UPI0002AE7236|nr:5-methylcytosine restriction system component- like protein [Brachyspira hampsonii]ELV04525.1 5-methylcytosine restriction system component- like protein [Brachyspira hampsonii 30599]